MPQAISEYSEGAGASGHRSWYSCMGNVELPRRMESSLSLERFTLKLEALPTGRGLGKRGSGCEHGSTLFGFASNAETPEF